MPINDTTVNDEPPMPFRGVRASGWGRFGGKAALEEFTELRWITTPGQPAYVPDLAAPSPTLSARASQGRWPRDEVVTDAPGEAVDEYEAGCRRSDDSTDAHRSTSRPRQSTIRE